MTNGIDDLRFAVVDIETTGLEPSENHLLQIAVVLCDSSGTVEGTWVTYVKPPHWPFSTLGPRHVHGITRLALRRAPDAATALRALAPHLEGRVFTAHNVDFDLPFLQHHASRLGVHLPTGPVVCTLTLSRSLDRPASRSHRLTDLCEHYGVALERAHDALEDARATAGVLAHLIDESGVASPADLFAAAAPTGRRRPAQRRP